MKENQDIEQQILEALDQSPREDETLDALLDSEEGKELLCDILDLDDAVNRKMGGKPDADAAWSQFKVKKRTRIVSILRYAAACAAIVVFVVGMWMWNGSQSTKKPVAYQQENTQTQAPAEKPTFLEKIKNMATDKVNMVSIVANEQKNVTLPVVPKFA